MRPCQMSGTALEDVNNRESHCVEISTTKLGGCLLQGSETFEQLLCASN